MKLTKNKIIILSCVALLLVLLLVFCFTKALWPRGLKEAVFECATCCDKGDLKCNSCNGKKDYDCKDCYGNGEKLCTKCKGRGHVICSQCEGKGYVHDNHTLDTSYTCYPCQGNGTIECPKTEACSCDKGTVHCAECGENGRQDCPDC